MIDKSIQIPTGFKSYREMRNETHSSNSYNSNPIQQEPPPPLPSSSSSSNELFPSLGNVYSNSNNISNNYNNYKREDLFPTLPPSSTPASNYYNSNMSLRDSIRNKSNKRFNFVPNKAMVLINNNIIIFI